MPRMNVHVVEHTGAYHHLGNAWSAQVSRDRAKKFKKKGEPFEVYFNSPKEVAPSELKTNIYFPVR